MTVDIPDIQLERLDEIINGQKLILHLLSETMARSGQKMFWEISDIAAYYGKRYDILRTSDRYLLPRFGESAFPTGPARWPVEECLQWIAKPDDEKRRAYQEHVRQLMRAESRKRKAVN